VDIRKISSGAKRKQKSVGKVVAESILHKAKKKSLREKKNAKAFSCMHELLKMMTKKG
jgi:hypothetical protein